MADYLGPFTAFVLVLVLVWLGSSALLRADVETRVARRFEQLVKTDVLIPPNRRGGRGPGEIRVRGGEPPI
jgi:hypothetical protein